MKKVSALFLLLSLVILIVSYSLWHIKINEITPKESLVSKDIDMPKFSDYDSNNRGSTPQKPALVDFNSNDRARTYKTVLTAAESNGPNFAGHYTIATWGCGTECQSIAVIDSLDGRVYDGVGSQVGMDYNINSKLLVVNPPYNIYELYNNDSKKWNPSLTTRFYVWENNNFKLIKEAKINFNVESLDN